MVIASRRKFSIDEYHKLVDLGFFTENDRIELIRGEIIDMAPKRTPHSVCNSLVFGELYRLLYNLANVRGQEPIILPLNSEPEPDVVIAKKKADNYLSAHPTVEDIILVIEISDSTLQYDRETKLSLYAEVGINNYWIFNLVDNRLEVYSQPFADPQGKSDYRTKNIFLPNEKIVVPSFDKMTLELASVFPKSEI
ncbi:MAG: Uma2 family endonuclease [Xenococcaceae cyanobacterium MO_188.B32]|nr:Uma2 family endonuclease [Xenococcaceae cyanobacterium MO_188.B32]